MHVETIRLALLQVETWPIPAAAVAPAVGAAQSGDNTGMVMLVASFISQIKWNGMATVAIQAAKKSPHQAFGWINSDAPWMVRLVALIAGALTAVGVKWTFTNGTFIATGITGIAILTALWNIAQNYLFQFAWFKILFRQDAAVTAPVAKAS